MVSSAGRVRKFDASLPQQAPRACAILSTMTMTIAMTITMTAKTTRRAAGVT